MTHSSLRLWGLGVAALTGAVLAGVFAWAVDNRSYSVWGAVIVVPVVVALNVWLIWRACARENDPFITRVLALGFAAKLLGTVVRYSVAYIVYDGAADAERYNVYASVHYGMMRDGTFVWDWAGKGGTQYMELFTTALYTVTGPSPLAGFVVFSSFAFWGAYLLFRAFRTAVPTGDSHRYALLLFLLPSMLYWPSSIGKESWLMLFVGVTALGAARHFARRRGGLALLAVGAVGTAVVRPHIALLLFAALLLAQLFRPTRARSLDVLAKVAGVVVMVLTLSVLASQSATLLGIDDFSWQAISETVNWRSGLTEQGGSAFTPVPLASIFGVPMAILTVLVRPFPWEASNAQLMLQSLEGLFLLVLTMRAWTRLRHLPQLMRTNSYIVFAVVYASAFIVAFSGFSNFGILARQRVLMLPLFLVLLALPTLDEERSRARQEGLLSGARR
jgi:hypothetical protein